MSNLRYVGRTWSDNANLYRIPGYAVVDSGISVRLNDGISVTGRVYNLFDKDYATTSYNDEQWLLGRPRTRAGLELYMLYPAVHRHPGGRPDRVG